MTIRRFAGEYGWEEGWTFFDIGILRLSITIPSCIDGLFFS